MLKLSPLRLLAVVLASIIILVPSASADTPKNKGLLISPLRQFTSLDAGTQKPGKVTRRDAGMRPWYDRATLLGAMAKVTQRRDAVKLVFVGGRYPGLGPMGLGQRYMGAVSVAKELGLYNRNVFFDIAWVRRIRNASFSVHPFLLIRMPLARSTSLRSANRLLVSISSARSLWST